MTIEVYITDDIYLREGLIELNSILDKDINKELIVNTINYHIKSSTWPLDYYKLRDEVIPEVYGEKAAKVLFWCIFGGWMIGGEKRQELVKDIISKDNFDFLKYLILTYSKTFIKAKEYNVNPLGYNELNFTYDSNDEKANLNFLRSDDKSLLFKVNGSDVVRITKDLMFYYTQLYNAKKTKLSAEDKASMREIIDLLGQLSEGKNER